MMNRLRPACAAILVLLAPLCATAQRMYIDDQLEVTLRSGKSTQHSILRMLKSGTPVQVMETDTDSGYTRVTIDSGAEGWVLTRFISELPAARERLATAQTQLQRLRADKAANDSRFGELNAARSDIEQERDSLLRAKSELEAQLREIRSTAANAMAIAESNRQLEARLEAQDERLRATLAENSLLADRTTQRWFIIGAGAVILGALLGWILPRVRWRKRNRWGDL